MTYAELFEEKTTLTINPVQMQDSGYKFIILSPSQITRALREGKCLDKVETSKGIIVGKWVKIDDLFGIMK